MTMREYWIVKGYMNDDPDTLEAYRSQYGIECKAGDVEWQISDGPPGERGSSADFPSLELAIANTAPAIYHYCRCPDPVPEVESFLPVRAEDADFVGRLLLACAQNSKSASLWGEGDLVVLRHMGNALLALGNDTDALICKEKWEWNEDSA